MAEPSTHLKRHDDQTAEAARLVEDDLQSRFFAALGLEPTASVDDIRSRQVELAHRMRGFPEAVAAINHSAEMAVEDRNWRVDIPAILQRVKSWRPAWDVPESDITLFLAEVIKYDVLVSSSVEVTKSSHSQGDPVYTVYTRAIGILQSGEVELRKSMAEWYWARAKQERGRFILPSLDGVSFFVHWLAGAKRPLTLEAENRALLWIRYARKLDPARREVAEFEKRVLEDIAILTTAPGFDGEMLMPLDSAPSLRVAGGFGTTMYGHSSYEQRTDSYLATRYLVALWIPLLPLGRYRVRSVPPRSYSFLGRVPLRRRDKWHIAASVVAVVGLIVVLNMMDVSGEGRRPSSYSSPSYPTSTSSPANTQYGGTPRNSVGYGQRSNPYRPTDAGVSALEAEIEQARARLRNLESSFQQQQATLESYKASIDLYGARIKRMESAASSGEAVDRDEYESALRQHNYYVDLYNTQLVPYQSDYADYEALLNRTNLKIEEYNRRTGAR
jgi:hypothetical protein